ncbi:Contactin-5 [Ameca splendens]|uniref:Contactin-5 n=1 Tax=Ameca splendens TaxID=208324 RepID=A0ABV0Z2T9_9TELE
MLSLPEGGTYIIEVHALSEGGEGAFSSQIRVVTSSGVRAKSSQCSLHCPTWSLTWTVVILVLLVPSASCHLKGPEACRRGLSQPLSMQRHPAHTFLSLI